MISDAFTARTVRSHPALEVAQPAGPARWAILVEVVYVVRPYLPPHLRHVVGAGGGEVAGAEHAARAVCPDDVTELVAKLPVPAEELNIVDRPAATTTTTAAPIYSARVSIHRRQQAAAPEEGTIMGEQ